ncbi:MAG: ABC transporter ATP-binding protein [Promethearchaeota archaeon]|nr:MAG: ABC transporter ATP-binding protein [Candidatus Lokiarchaeota archaeon]
MFSGLEAEEYDRTYKDRTLLRRIFTYFAPYKRYMLIVVIFLTLSSLITSFVPLATSIAINSITESAGFAYLIFLIVLILIFNILSFVFNYYRQINGAKAIANVVLDLRGDATKSILDHDLSFFDKNPIGKIVSRINSDSRDFGQTVELSLEVISSLLVMLIIIILLTLVNTLLVLIMLIAIPLFFVVALSFRKYARRMTLLGQRALASVNSFVKESFSGIQIAKTFRQEQKLYNQFEEVNLQSYKVNLRRAFVLNAIFPSLGIVQGIVTTFLVYLGGNFLIFDTINIGDFNLFLQSLNLLFFPLLTIASFWPQFQSGLSASERIFAIIDTPPVVIQNDEIIPGKLTGQIEFKNLTFQYEEKKKVFDNFNLKIAPGESLAIVGHTGAGKSSIANLLARFYEFQEGDILIDGKSIRSFDLQAYRQQIGIIPQVPFLWADTVEHNISYGCSSASCEDVLSALDKAGGSEWIDSLTNGLDTMVGERGSLISMGQRQLIAFARVLLENPSILILDEATASVDPFTETRIQDALEQTIQGRTSIIIAHRLWTVRHVDRIIVLDEGKIIEEGNHDELMKRNGYYADLYNTYFRHQSLKYIEEMGKT